MSTPPTTVGDEEPIESILYTEFSIFNSLFISVVTKLFD